MSQKHFTLMEMMIVIVILSILSAMLVPAVIGVKERSRIVAAKAEILQLVAALESYNAKFGDYPPTNLKELGLIGNKINEGNESLVLCLSTEIHGPFYEFQEDRLENRDLDTRKTNVTQSMFKSSTLFEWVDEWGNPYIYIHYRDFQPNKQFKYMLGENNEDAQAVPQKSSKTGNYYGHLKFQLWSVGPNQINENGGGDDLGCWVIRNN